jgi:hypothetical protein
MKCFSSEFAADPFMKNNCRYETAEKLFQSILTLDFHFYHRFLCAGRMKVPQWSPSMSHVGAVPQPPLAFASETHRSRHLTRRPPLRLPWPSAIRRERPFVWITNERDEEEIRRKKKKEKEK